MVTLTKIVLGLKRMEFCNMCITNIQRSKGDLYTYQTYFYISHYESKKLNIKRNEGTI